MKSYNILKVIFLLLINEKMTIKTLAEELEVSQRTVKRYIADIVCLDLPINAIQGKNGGVYFDKDEFYKKFEVTAREIDYIIDAFYANKSLEFLFKGEYIDFSDVLRKIKVNNIIEVDFSKWLNNTEDDINFSVIKRSISTLRQIEFEYYDMYNNHSHRIVDPYKIGFKENNWYMLGRCHLRDDLRVFKIRKMRRVRLLDRTFVRDEAINFDFTKYYTISSKVTLKMEVSKEVIAKVYEDFESSEIIEENDLLIVTSNRVNNPSLLTLVLSYGGYAKVISPKEIIVQLLDNANIVKKIYKGDSVCPVDGL